MKRIIISVLILLAMGPVAMAQVASSETTAPENAPKEQKFNFRVGAAVLPTVPTFATIFLAIGKALTLEEDQKAEFTSMPWVSVEGLYSINKRVSVGLDVSYYTSECIVTNKNTGEVEEKSDYLTFVGLLPEVRLNYVNKKAFTMYGSLGVGALLSTNNDPLVFSFQLVPVGIEFGKKLYGFADLGIGVNYIGGRAGIGFKF